MTLAPSRASYGAGAPARHPADVGHRASAERVARLVRRTRGLLVLFIVGLVLSGVTAFPLEAELRTLTTLLGAEAGAPPGANAVVG